MTKDENGNEDLAHPHCGCKAPPCVCNLNLAIEIFAKSRCSNSKELDHGKDAIPLTRWACAIYATSTYVGNDDINKLDKTIFCGADIRMPSFIMTHFHSMHNIFAKKNVSSSSSKYLL